MAMPWEADPIVQPSPNQGAASAGGYQPIIQGEDLLRAEIHNWDTGGRVGPMPASVAAAERIAAARAAQTQGQGKGLVAPAATPAAIGSSAAAATSPATSAPWESDPIVQPASSTGGAIARGVLGGLDFGTTPMLSGVAEAAPQGVKDTIGQVPVLGRVANFVAGGANLLAGGEGAQQRYDQEAASQRAQLAADAAQHPIASAVGTIGGALATAPFLGALNIVRAPAVLAETAPVLARVGNAALRLGARGANSAATGGLYGSAYGAGSAEGDLGQHLQGGLEGAKTGAALGLAGTAAGAGVRAAGRGVGQVADFVTGAVNPNRVAAGKVAAALTADGANTVNAGQRIGRANAAGSPVNLADIGGESTRALARAAANTSPVARDTINSATGDRFASQGERFSDFIRGLVGRSNKSATTDQLKAAARRINQPAYDKAYKAGASGVWNADLENLVKYSPDVQAAINDAGRTMGNKAAVGGAPPPPNPFVKTKGGLQPKTAPTLQFWDAVKQNLDDAINEAKVKNPGRARDLTALKDALVKQLDAAVPSYATARAGAAAFFGAQDALEAGAKFVSSRIDNAEAAKALAKMNRAERALFSEGFASELINKVQNIADNRDLLNSIFLKSSASRARIEMALGPQAATRIEAYLRAESIMNQLRTAMGNSTTVRQLAEKGLLGGIGQVGGAGAIGFVVGGGNITDPKAILAGVLGGILIRTRAGVQADVANRVAQMLTSGDPKVIEQAVSRIGNDPKILNALKGAGDLVSRALVATKTEQVPALAGMHAQADANQQQ